MTKGDHQTGAH